MGGTAGRPQRTVLKHHFIRIRHYLDLVEECTRDAAFSNAEGWAYALKEEAEKLHATLDKAIHKEMQEEHLAQRSSVARGHAAGEAKV